MSSSTPNEPISTRQVVDLVLFASRVIPVIPTNVVLSDHAIVVHHGKIIDLLPIDDGIAKYTGTEEHHLRDHIVVPGLINAHTHMPLSLLRGLADDLPVQEWLMQFIWPAEGEFLSPEFVRDGVYHAVAEMLRGGTTTCNDMFHFASDVCDVIERIGMRACIGSMILELPSAYAASTEVYFDKAKTLLEKYKRHDLIRISLAPHNTAVNGEATLQQAHSWAEQYNVPFNIHIHETESECYDSQYQNKTSLNCHRSDQPLRPLANFKRLGLLSSRLICANTTQLTDSEIQDLADAHASVVHCPTANLKLAAGICPLAKLLENGLNVALGTEGGFCNKLDMFAEMKTAALLAKVQTMDAATLPPSTVLQMATLNGARAIGLESEIGSIEVDKRADLIAIRCDNIEMLPVYSALSHVVYVAGREK